MNSALAGACLLSLMQTQPQATTAPWQVSPKNCLVWDGKPYMPIGLRVSERPEDIQKAAAAGIHDVIIELPADGSGWSSAIEAAKKNNLRYLISISSVAPAARVYSVEPQGYRREGIISTFNYNFNLPDAESALATLVAKRDGSVRWSSRVPVVNGFAKVTGDTKGLEQVLILYPLRRDVSTPDVWEGLDRHRDNLLRVLKSTEFGPGFRGLINPLGAAVSFPGKDSSTVPASPLFRFELEAILAEKYKAVPDALRAWAIGANDVKTFQHLSRLIPLWNGIRGAGGLYDPETEKIYVADSSASKAWTDIRTAVQQTIQRRYDRLITALRQAVNCPIYQEFSGWSGPYASRNCPLTGVSFRMNGTRISEAVDDTSRPASTVLRKGVPTQLIAEEILLGTPETQKTSIADLLKDSESMGVRAWFFRAETPEQVKEIAALAQAHETDDTASTYKTDFLPYPDSARNPCIPARIIGGKWWLPSPGSGDRIYLGSTIQGYRYNGELDQFVALWSTSQGGRFKFRLKDPKRLKIETLDGSDPKPRIKGMEIELTLTPMPLILREPEELPAPLATFVETSQHLTKLFGIFGTKVDGGGGQEFTFIDTLKNFDPQPGTSLNLLTTQLANLAPKVSPYVWVEAENIREMNFSDIGSVAGASSGKTLDIDTKMDQPDGGYFAKFTLRPRSSGSQEIWIAGRIPEANRTGFYVQIGEKVFRINDRPVSLYGDGLGWYKLGELPYSGGDLPAKIGFNLPRGGHASIDVMVCSPPGFQPDGPNLPLEWLSALPEPPARKGSGGQAGPPPIPPALSASALLAVR